MRLVTAALFCIAFSLPAVAQHGSVHGVVLDASDNTAIPGANVLVADARLGSTSDMRGVFRIRQVPAGEHVLRISFVGYATQEMPVRVVAGEISDVGTIRLTSQEIGIEAVEVLAATAVDRETPVAFSVVDGRQVESRLGSQEFPEILNSTPSVFATKQGGGYGDGRINVRGFAQNNVAVLINGVPVNDPESGWVFWSNWVGLGDVTRMIQVQRGLGASKLALNSIGGTINVITRTTDMERGGFVGTMIGDSGFRQHRLTLSTGLTDDRWALTFSGSRTSGDGFIDATYIDAWSWFGSLSARLSDNHQLVLTGFGAPQRHGQRQTRELVSTFDTHERGIRYNSGWGLLHGQPLNIANNYYHKPQFALNHYWTMREGTVLSSSAYLSLGEGGGTGPFGSVNIPRLPNGQIDFDSIYDFNRGRIPDATGMFNMPNDDGEFQSRYMLVNFTNAHSWYGLLSSLNHDFTDNLALTAGVDVRSYVSKQHSEIRNLIGGDYTINFFDVNHPNQIARTGDRFFYDNDNFVNWGGLFGQLEYTMGQLSVFGSGTVSNTSYRRIDRYNYMVNDPLRETGWEHFLGYSGKTGANYRFDDMHNVYANAGFFSRAPFFRDVFPAFRNEVATEINNESVLAAELGYGFRSGWLAANLNLYNTSWRDKSVQVGVTEPDGTTSWANISGQGALHRGVELDFVATVTPRFQVHGLASLGDWKWTRDVEAQYANQDQTEVTQVTIYASGLHVGDAAQTSAMLGGRYDLGSNIEVAAEVFHYNRLFAQFDPVGRNDPSLRVDSWQLPAYTLMNAHLAYGFSVADLHAVVHVNVNNVFNTRYIADALDGAGHDRATSRVFYGFGRTATLGVTVRF